MFTKESLEKLREKIDLVEALSSYVDLKRSGATYKGLCPFHQEKTPSFVIQKGDTHYHCFGCGAHGDSIAFFMTYLNYSFVETVEALAEKFHVPLEEEEVQSHAVINKTALKEACALASQFYHAYLLYSEEGRAALRYLYQRGLSPDFIQQFEVGYAPKEGGAFLEAMKRHKISSENLEKAGLLTAGTRRPFFRERITFPIRDAVGAVVGFSARKIKEETYGGKYINSPETPLFKKTHLLFGLNYSRRRMAKQRKAIVVEGQIDCLRLIEAGLNLTVASLGTAFGSSHVEEIEKLGVREVYLLFDPDPAGQKAASKAGDLFQKKGIEVRVVHLPAGSDPDTFLADQGVAKLIELLEKGESYLAFQTRYAGADLNPTSPAGKAELVQVLKTQIQGWEDPIMVHESLRKLASLLQVPEEMVGITPSFLPPFFAQKAPSSALGFTNLNPDRVLEIDLLRWLVLDYETFAPTARTYLKEEHFQTPPCRHLFTQLLVKKNTDLLLLAADLEDQSLIDEILKKKVNKERAQPLFLETLQKLLDRQWMHKREEIKMAMHRGGHSEEKMLELAKEFDALKSQRPPPVALLAG